MRCLLLSSVLAVAVGAACSDNDTPAREGAGTATLTTVPDVDACVLVDASDAASVLGSPAVVDATPAGGFGETSSCAWIRPEPPRLFRYTVAHDEAQPLSIAQTSPDIAISPNGGHVAYPTGRVGWEPSNLLSGPPGPAANHSDRRGGWLAGCPRWDRRS